MMSLLALAARSLKLSRTSTHLMPKALGSFIIEWVFDLYTSLVAWLENKATNMPST